MQKSSATKGTNLWILFFAILIASLGLNLNSTAVVIGAMLISPLIGPIVGIGFGVATNDTSLIRLGLGSYFFSTGVGLLASTLYFLASPIRDAHSEILSRTLPSFYDVLIALFGGFAGIIAMSSKQKGTVIPGVAIATALMPPLCTAGYGIATFQWHYFAGAFYLYLINSVFIFAATILMTRYMKFPTRKYEDPAMERREKRITWSVVILTLLPSIYLGYYIISNNRFIDNANRFIQSEANFENDFLLKKDINPAKHAIVLTYGGREISDTEKAELRNRMRYYNLENADLQIEYGFSFLPEETNSAQVGQMGMALSQVDLENKKLKARLDSISKQNALGHQVFLELQALYPGLEAGIIQPVSMQIDTMKIPVPAYLVSLTFREAFPVAQEATLEKWLETRLGTTHLKLELHTQEE